MRGLGNYTGSGFRQPASAPMLQVLIAAIQTAQSKYTFHQAQSDNSHRNRLIKSVAGAHLCNTVHANTEFCCWNLKHLAADFVIRRGRKVVGIRV